MKWNSRTKQSQQSDQGPNSVVEIPAVLEPSSLSVQVDKGDQPPDFYLSSLPPKSTVGEALVQGMKEPS